MNLTEDDIKQAALLIGQALFEIDKIVDGADVDYTNYRNRGIFDTKKMTMKEAKPKAKQAANLLRQAWEILDPVK